MSLKAVHVFLVAAATLMALAAGGWFLAAYFRGEGWFHLPLGVLSLAVGGALVRYGKYVLKKLQPFGYL
jgi:hypothetical protein